MASGCTPVSESISYLYETGLVYKAEIRQGNVFNMVQVDQLKAGMTPQEVHDIMGGAIVHDAFHLYQWDYINSSSVRGKMTVYRVSVQFDRDTHLVNKITETGKIPK